MSKKNLKKTIHLLKNNTILLFTPDGKHVKTIFKKMNVSLNNLSGNNGLLILQAYNGLFKDLELYSTSFAEEVLSILPSSDVFNALPYKNKKKINNSLKELFSKERTYKAIMKATPAYSTHTKKIFSKELKLFIKEYYLLLNIENNHNSLKNCILFFLNNIKEVLIGYLGIDLDLEINAIIQKLDIKELFCNITLIMSKTVYSSLQLGSDDFLVIKQSQIIYLMRDYFYLYFITVVIDNIPASLLNKNKKTSLIRLFEKNQPFFLLKKKIVDKITMSIAIYLLDCLENANFFDKKETVKCINNSKKKYIEFTLKSVFRSLDLFTGHLPELIVPSKWLLNGYNDRQESLLKKISNGFNSAIFSVKSIEVFNFMGSNKLIIDKIAYDFFSKLFINSNINIQNESFITQKKYYLLLSLLKNLKAKTLAFQNKIDLYYKALKMEIRFNESRKQEFLFYLENFLKIKSDSLTWSCLKKSKLGGVYKVKEDFIADILIQKKKILNYPHTVAIKSSGLTEEQFQIMQNLKSVELNMKKIKAQLSIQNVVMVYAKILHGYPIYFGNSCDYRGRIYPETWFFSRTSGFFKYLVSNYNLSKINDMGLFWMIYNVLYNSDLIQTFLSFNCINVLTLKIKVKTLQDNFSWFTKYQDKIKESLNSIYGHLLFLNIIDLPNSNWLTGFNLEIDQSCSVGVLYSLMFKDDYLMFLTRLQGPHTGFYNHLLENIHDLVPPTNKFYKYFKDNKDLIKRITMYFLYSQGVKNRAKAIKHILSEQFPDTFNLSKYSYEDSLNIFEIAMGMSGFMDRQIPDTMEKSELLLKLAIEIFEISGQVFIKTKDDIFFYWTHYQQGDKQIHHHIHPITNKVVRIEYTSYGEDIPNVKKIKSSFLPNLTHSIDSWLIREITYLLQHNNSFGKSVKIQTIHDAVMIHPNDVMQFYSVVDHIYKNDMNNLIWDFFLENALRDIPQDRLIKINKLKKDLQGKMHFKNKPLLDSRFNPMDIYLPEGY